MMSSTWCFRWQLSFVCLTEGRMIFQSQEIQELNIDINGIETKLGFLVKMKSKGSGCCYQFVHLVLQEFFSAIHIFSSNQFIPVLRMGRLHIIKDTIKNKSLFLQSQFTDVIFHNNTSLSDDVKVEFLENVDLCFPIIVGLEGLKNSSNEILKVFVERIKTEEKQTLPLMEIAHQLLLRPKHESEYHMDEYVRLLLENGCDLPEHYFNIYHGLSFKFEVNEKYKQKLVFNLFRKLLKNIKEIEKNESIPNKETFSTSIDDCESVIKRLQDAGLKCNLYLRIDSNCITIGTIGPLFISK